LQIGKEFTNKKSRENFRERLIKGCFSSEKGSAVCMETCSASRAASCSSELALSCILDVECADAKQLINVK
jgi:hypothetical protein